MTAGGPPAFIPSLGGYGVLAAGRALSRAGIDVISPEPDWRSLLHYSRAFSRTVPRPIPGSSPSQLADWLADAGGMSPGAVLMPALDSITWIVAEHRERLSHRWRLYYPAPDAVLALLDKGRMHTLARAAGLDTPDSWAPSSVEEADALARGLPYPVAIKPRTHVALRHWLKGRLAHDEGEFRRLYRALSAELRPHREILERDPSLAFPLVERFVPGAQDSIHNLCGFIDPQRGIYAATATHKVLQRPRRFGVGIAFESAPVDPGLAGGVRELLTGIGFHGMFELEFADVDGSRLLLDANPRIYHSIALAGAHGLDLPVAWYHAALGEWDEVERVLAGRGEARPPALVNRFELGAMVLSCLVTGRMNPRQALDWARWPGRREATGTVTAADDPWPARLDPLLQLYSFVRDPRYFAGTFLKD